MTSSVPEDWTAANQRYLITAIREVREELELYHKRKGRKDRGEKHITVGTADQGKETAGVARPGAPPALETLTSVFRLTSFEKKILLMCTGAELDSSFASLVAALQGDPGSFLPTFSSAMTIFPDAHWSALSPGAPLRYWQLVEAGSGRSLTRSPLRIDERILHYLTGVSHPDERLTGVIERVSGSGGLVASHREQAGRLLEMLRKSSAEAVFPVIMIQGEDTGDMLDIVSGACSLPGLVLWFMTSGSVPGNARERAELVRLWNREAALGTGALFIDCSEADTGDLSQLQAVRAETFIQHPAHWVGQRGDLAQAFGHGGNALVVQRQPVEHGGGKAHCRADLHVERIGLFDGGGVLFERIGHGEQAGVLVAGGQPGQVARSRFSLLRQLGHLLGQRHAVTLSQIWKLKSGK